MRATAQPLGCRILYSILPSPASCLTPKRCCRIEPTPHEAPQFSAFVDREAQHAQLHVTFKRRRALVTSPAGATMLLLDFEHASFKLAGLHGCM